MRQREIEKQCELSEGEKGAEGVNGQRRKKDQDVLIFKGFTASYRRVIWSSANVPSDLMTHYQLSAYLLCLKVQFEWSDYFNCMRAWFSYFGDQLIIHGLSSPIIWVTYSMADKWSNCSVTVMSNYIKTSTPTFYLSTPITL